ncbi:MULTISPECIES: 1,2-phenylacetyl-CoA epoxidase subunit PaaC [Haloferax]|uniref:Phenylacetate-CoA oxygenase subunit PaaC n=1 Tax=Haloferax marinum TaxID=2666143 RepID=A0A6A8GB70_9EURY|nr:MULTISPECIES: 1,2-phenylacetyl-CoA epoxidase subunit PaaC [Haloferax]KAB1191114.1 phenylacetate-CoA oxygenase subunit PaaC [Haloferax sp. CBA1150]MRW97995.1 phenylacetate-CoA oxygenase subunit PaaC [Haloferax marinum]
MAAAQQLPGPQDLTDEQREAVEMLLYRLADDEFVIAERYTEWQVRAPTIESDLSVANIAQDELGHARLWYDLLEDFGYEEPDLIWEREAGDWRHSTLCELPFGEGDWADFVVRSYLYDEAEFVRVKALEGSSYPRLADRVEKVLAEERYHREHARSWLERLCEDDDSRARVQDAVDRLLPYALTLFSPTDEEIEARIDELGLRTENLLSMREAWLDEVVPTLESAGLHVEEAELPEQYDVHHVDFDLPDETGRDQSHTDYWFDLFDEFTKSYRELGRHSAMKIMKDPDDE